MPTYEHEDNSLCEICIENPQLPIVRDNGYYYWINQHCIDLRRNRESREHKNYKPIKTVF